MDRPFWGPRPTVRTRKRTGLVRTFRREGDLEQFLAAEVWSSDHMDMSRGVFRTWTGDLYQRDLLESGQMIVAGEPARLERITQPVLVISGEYDVVTPPAAAEPLLHLSSSSVAQAPRLSSRHVRLVLCPRPLPPA